MPLEELDPQHLWLQHLASVHIKAGLFPSQRQLAAQAELVPSQLNSLMTGARSPSKTARSNLATAIAGDEDRGRALLEMIANAPPPPDKATMDKVLELIKVRDTKKKALLEALSIGSATAAALTAGGLGVAPVTAATAVYAASQAGSRQWKLRREAQDLKTFVALELSHAGFEPVILGATTMYGGMNAKPDLWIPKLPLAIETKTGLDRPERMLRTIGHLSLVRAAFNCSVALVTTDRLPPAIEDLLEQANIQAGWLEGNDLRGLDLAKISRDSEEPP